MNMIFVAMSKLHAQYGNPVKVGWLITAFALTAAASAAICGRLGDIYGRSRVLVCILAVALGGSVLSASTDDLTLIIVGRALQGASMAILPLCFGLLRENAPTERIPFGVGILGGTYVGTSGAAGLLGGVLVDMGTWQSIFVVSAASAGLAIALVVLFLPASPRRQQYGSVDLVGGLIFVPAIASILLAFSQANMSGWTWLSVSLLGLGGGALILWARYELAHQNPLINVRLLANRQILLTNICIFFAAVGPQLSPLVILPLLQQPTWTGVGLGVTATLAALLKLPGNVSAGVASVTGGFVAGRWGAQRVVLTGTLLSLTGWLLIYFIHDSVLSITLIFTIIMAPGMAMVSSCAPALIIDAVPEDRTSEATGLSQVIRNLGTTIGSQVVAITLASATLKGAEEAAGAFPTEGAYQLTFIVISCFAAASAVAISCVPGPRRAPLPMRGEIA
jgi:MFS family permease